MFFDIFVMFIQPLFILHNLGAVGVCLGVLRGWRHSLGVKWRRRGGYGLLPDEGRVGFGRPWHTLGDRTPKAHDLLRGSPHHGASLLQSDLLRVTYLPLSLRLPHHTPHGGPLTPLHHHGSLGEPGSAHGWTLGALLTLHDGSGLHHTCAHGHGLLLTHGGYPHLGLLGLHTPRVLLWHDLGLPRLLLLWGRSLRLLLLLLPLAIVLLLLLFTFFLFKQLF